MIGGFVTIEIEDIKPDLLKTISQIAKNENTSEKKVLNEILEEGIEKRENNKNKKNNKTIPDYLIANKDTYNPDPERRKKLVGIIKTDEPFDTAKAIEEIRRMEY